MNKNIDYLEYCRLLLQKEPNITPEEMCHNMHLSNYSVENCASSLHTFFESESTDSVCKILLNEFNHPLFKKNVYNAAMLAADYPQNEITAALDKYYPSDINRYAINLNSNIARPYANSNSNYHFGTGDFTVEAWVKTTNTGTIISQKGGPGGPGNGGFLLVIKPGGSIKLATDDGFGFYEVNSVSTSILDGNWHHILGTRKNSELSIHIDFKKIDATPRTNRWAGLNINNNLRLLIGATDQWQEDYNAFTGMIGEVRIWSSSITYQNSSEWEQKDWIFSDLKGCWSFFAKNPYDYSSQRNILQIDSKMTYSAWTLP